MERSVRSILNKLTLEKFEELYRKLLLVFAGFMDHIEVLAHEIFKKATVQHNFTAMYADLCARLDADLNNCSSDGPGGMAFRAAILFQCRQLFEASWLPLAMGKGVEDADQEAEVEAQALRKKAAIGNLRFIGEILVRGLVPASELFIIAEDLRQTPVVPEKLEALATLLTVAGPTLDNEAWEYHDQLKVIFWDIRGLTFSPEVPTRIRCLLRDVLDLRDAGWVDTKVATRDQGPKGLKQLRSEAAAESKSPKLRPSAEVAALSPAGSDSLMMSWPASPEVGAVPCPDVVSPQEAWTELEGMDPSYDESWGCGAYMVFVPMEMMDSSYLQATDMSTEMMSVYG
mmetsp:Transcript_25474/g.79400  ORF Transcript_25474/g.79400 Transcript_25474/m.79400 type:complete len:343 (+) Transcript_25474:174-1202(+)